MAERNIQNIIDTNIFYPFVFPTQTQTEINFSVSSGLRSILFVIDSYMDVCSAWFVVSTSLGVVGIKTIVSSNSISLSSSSNNILTLNKQAGNGPVLLFLTTFGAKISKLN